jgi:CubicO group peptidase (beta-lactamase class C family)
VLNLNDITFNKRLGKLIGGCFEMPYVSYCHPLCAIKQTISKEKMKTNKMKNVLFFMMILMSSNVKSQKIEINELDSAILTLDRIIENDSRILFKNVESVIVFYDGNIWFEKYYNGFRKDSLHHIQSQTKSIVSLLIGIAIDNGFVESENDLVCHYLPEYFNTTDSLKSSITIKDLLTMSAGFEWEEMIPLDDPRNDNINMYRSGKWLNYALSRKMTEKPFTRFNYNSGCPMIIAGIIEKTTKMSLDKFAEIYLFKPLGISDYRWIKDSTGFCHAGGGLYLKPADMLKTGILLINNGKWKDQQIISENWIKKISRPYFTTNFDISYYKYFYWIREMILASGKTTIVVSAEGAGGQKLNIFPEYGLIVALTERNFNTPQVSPIFIRESVLPLLK